MNFNYLINVCIASVVFLFCLLFVLTCKFFAGKKFQQHLKLFFPLKVYINFTLILITFWLTVLRLPEKIFTEKLQPNNNQTIRFVLLPERNEENTRLLCIKKHIFSIFCKMYQKESLLHFAHFILLQQRISLLGYWKHYYSSSILDCTETEFIFKQQR